MKGFFDESIMLALGRMGMLGEKWHASEEETFSLFASLTDATYAMARKGLAITRAEAMKMDTIDLRDMSYTKVKEILDEYDGSQIFFNSIPCFSEGILRAKQDVATHFKITGLDLDDKVLSIRLDVYHDILIDGRRFWIKILSSDYVLTAVLPSMKNLGIDIEETVNFRAVDSLNFEMQYKQLFDHYDFPSEYKKKWFNLSKTYAERLVDTVCRSQRYEDEVKWFGDEFMVYMILVNFMFSKEKLSCPVSKGKPRNKIKIEQSAEIKEPKKKVRLLGGIKFVSEERPQRSSYTTVRRYKVASWKVRGHQSHSKNGKVFYVPERTNHRRAGNSEATKVPQRIIKGI